MCRDCRVFVAILRLVFVLTGTSIASSVFGHSSVVGAGEVSGRNVLYRALFRCKVQDAARRCELTKMGFGLEGKIFGGSPYKSQGQTFCYGQQRAFQCKLIRIHVVLTLQ